MPEEHTFGGLLRVFTKGFGEINDEAQATGLFDNDPYTSTDARLMLLRGARFVTSGNATFLVGKMVAPYEGNIFDMAFNVDEIEESPATDANIWIPTTQIIGMMEERSGN